MKNAKIILLFLVGVLIFCSFGCGGGGGGVDEQGNAEPQDEEIDEIVSELIDKILSLDSDGSPMIFDYAPELENLDEIAAVDAEKLHFVKYISSKDLDSDGKFVKTIHLDKDSKYVIKYSHGGRSLNNSLFSVEIIAPDKKEMILDWASLGNPKVSSDITPVEILTEEEINALLEQYIASDEISRDEVEDIKKEIALYSNNNGESEIDTAYYVNTDIGVIPEENPCVILYSFKAPMTGDYEFAVSELELLSDDLSADLSVNKYPSVPFEFRIYGVNEAHSAFDGEVFEFSPRDIIDLQRILLSSATEFNENGLPIDFREDQSEIEALEEINAAVSLEEKKSSLRTFMEAKIKRYKEKLAEKQARARAEEVIVDNEVNNVPYDPAFQEGIGFYAHSGLRAVTNVVDDEAFSRKVIQNFSTPSGAINLRENFSVNIIATQEEHDRTMELNAMSNFVLLRDALGYTNRQDYARLGSNHTKIISARYELIENRPRMIDPKLFKLYDDALDELKKDGAEKFLKEYGDYFVAGYTWGNRYNATIEIVTVPGESYYRGARHTYQGTRDTYDVRDAATICNDANECIQDILRNVKDNAVSERDNGRSITSKVQAKERLLKELQNDFHNVTIRIIQINKTGHSKYASLSFADFTNDLANFIKSAKQTPRSQYEKLYVTLRRYREIEAARPYIPEAITVKKSLYNSIRDLNKKIFITRCYYNALMAIPASNLEGGMSRHEEWKREFETNLITDMKGGLNNICANERLVKEYYNKFDALHKKYKALAERYNFYRYFVLVQKKESSPSWSDSDDEKDTTWTRGFTTYDKSAIVKKDIEAGSRNNYEHSEPWYKGPRGATFSGSWSNERVIWFETGFRNTNHCQGRDVNGKTIGKKSFNWKYIGAGSRRCEVFLHLKTVKMPASDYPFVGLD